MALAKIKTKDDINLVLVLDDRQSTLEVLTKKKIEILKTRKRGSSLYPPVMEVKNTAS